MNGVYLKYSVYIVLAAAIGWRLEGAVSKHNASAAATPVAGCAPADLVLDAQTARREIARIERELQKSAPTEPYIVVDTHANILQLRTRREVSLEMSCSTGSGGILEDGSTGRKWTFSTPRGVFRVESKLVEPWWRKPDWAFIEEGRDVPADPAQRLDPEMLGEYAIGFGNDYYIHGTIYERLLGVSVTHGCVRVGSEDLKKIYERVRIGTPVYIF
jgi:hypothetical protein